MNARPRPGLPPGVPATDLPVEAHEVERVAGLPEDVTCADCGWLGPWFESYRVLEPRERQSGRRGFYLCVPCWDRLVGAATLAAFR